VSDVFQLFADEQFRFGHCFVRVYDRRQTDVFPDDFLYLLYRSAKPRLSNTFCGMADISAPTICAYLSSRRPLLLMCVDNPKIARGFDVIGFSFPTIWAGPPMSMIDPDPGRSMLLGYCYTKEWWGTPEITVTAMLMGIYFFHTFNLLTLQGQSYPHNQLTRRFLAQFGTKTVGTLPKILFDGKQMIDSVQSCLTREDFIRYVERTLLECSKL
jgi:hypothetical protein